MQRKSCLAFAAALLLPAAVSAQPVLDPYASLRWRLELVDQQGFPRDATASTLRVRAGLKAGPWHGFTAQVEGEAITRLGPEHYNDTLNGLTQFPVVADPSDHMLNQAFVGWSDKSVGSVVVGRKALNLDNQRWVGSVDWRQNDQTLDMARAEVTALKGVSLSYAHAWQVNRIFGPRSPQGIWRDTDIHLLRGAADVKPLGQIVAYGYLLDVPDAPIYGTSSFGARLTGRQTLGKVALLYAAEYARQTDRGNNPRDFGLDYVLLEPGIAAGPLTAKLGFERLEGNGAAALQTPLATLHAFNGWADKFLTTPPDGLRDLYLDVTVTPKGKGVPKGLALKAVMHDFRSTVGNRAYGREFNAQLLAPVRPNLTLLARAALYQSRGFASDTMKLWLQAEASF
jgi:hypothetical protein